MFGDFSNKVKTAIDRIGGPTKAARLCGVANATIHAWVVKRRVPDIDQAKKIAAASGIEVSLLRRTK